MATGKRLARLAFTRSALMDILRGLLALEEKLKSEARSTPTQRAPIAMDLADVNATKQRVIEAIATLAPPKR